MKLKSISSSLLSLLLAILTIATPVSRSVVAQQPAPASAVTPESADLAPRLAAIGKAIDDKRKQLGIPGVSIVIVKDDKIIYLKGLGVRDFEKQLPVTPDTLFAIGSAS